MFDFRTIDTETAESMFGASDGMELANHELVITTLTFDHDEAPSTVLAETLEAVNTAATLGRGPRGLQFRVYDIETDGDWYLYVIVDVNSAAEFSD